MQSFKAIIGYGFTGDHRRIDRTLADEAIDRHCTRLAERFGGFTLTRGDGGWIGPNGELVKEPVVIVEVFIGGQLDTIRDFRRLVEDFARALEQRSFAVVEPNGEADIHDVPSRYRANVPAAWDEGFGNPHA